MSTTTPSTADGPSPSHQFKRRQKVKEHAEKVAGEILEDLRKDHRFFSNCFRQIRTVEIQDKSRTKTRHLADPTPFSESGTVEERRLVESPPDLDAPPGHPDREATREWRSVGVRPGMMCECGMGHHSRRDRPVKKHVGIRYVRQLSTTIHDFRDDYRRASNEDDYAKVKRWDHDEERLVRCYKRAKTNADGGGQGTDIIERALVLMFIADQLP